MCGLQEHTMPTFFWVVQYTDLKEHNFQSFTTYVNLWRFKFKLSPTWDDDTIDDGTLLSGSPQRNYNLVVIDYIKNKLIKGLFQLISLSISTAACMTHIHPSHNTQEEKSLQSDTFPRKQLPTPLLAGMSFFFLALPLLFLYKGNKDHVHHLLLCCMSHNMKYNVYLEEKERETGIKREIFQASKALRPYPKWFKSHLSWAFISIRWTLSWLTSNLEWFNTQMKDGK